MCITSNLSWSQHIVLMLLLRLNMLHQHLFGCSLESKRRAFSALVLPILENACTVWNPHTQQNIKLLQAVQTCGARWVCSARYDPLIFHWSPPSSQCCINLHWPSLQVRHKFLTILAVYDSFHHQNCLKFNNYFTVSSTCTRFLFTVDRLH